MTFLHLLPLSHPLPSFLCVLLPQRLHVSKAAPSNGTYTQKPLPCSPSPNSPDLERTWSFLDQKEAPSSSLQLFSCYLQCVQRCSRAEVFGPSSPDFKCQRTPPLESGSLRPGGSLVWGPSSCSRRGWPGGWGSQFFAVEPERVGALRVYLT